MLGKSCLPKTCVNAINIYVFPKLYNQISISSINASLAGLARRVQIKILKTTTTKKPKEKKQKYPPPKKRTLSKNT